MVSAGGLRHQKKETAGGRTEEVAGVVVSRLETSIYGLRKTGDYKSPEVLRRLSEGPWDSRGP